MRKPRETTKIDLVESNLLDLPESHTIMDIDGVLADFTGSFLQRARDLGYGDIFPKSESEVTVWDYGVPKEYFAKVWDTVKSDPDFWSNIKPFPNAVKEMRFKPIAYITHRPIKNEVTIEWLRKNGFPTPERAITVADPKMKVIIAKQLGAKRIIDDRVDTCQTFIDAGLDAYVFTRPHNLLIEDVERIASLAEVDHNGLLKKAA